MPDSAPAIEESVPEDVEYCEGCGAMRQNNSKFCAVCGEAFAKEDINPPAPVQPVKKPVQESLEEPEDTRAE